ncbi:GntR family transcriptional regulator [Novosphingobium piscinae]|uniref:GntR family transcriptional regulator n=1 Tax=Novosphingobium piscinae TaxID=1507448 RepID=A0A7X1KNE1_9SPHN|nr:GntR family transcriptional regulator [Novosphingobium piscinae]MBC2667601.1 GntR family transcriptional regulator [Novosphingobium piscinae]
MAKVNVEDLVRDHILRGVFKPSTPLKMEELKERFDVGYSPIREALSRLAGEGLVLAEANKGFRVRPLNRADLYDIAVARCAVEKEALRRSMIEGDDGWESEIVAAMHTYRKKAAAAFDSAETLAAWELSHDRLHTALIAACGSPRLLDLQQRLQEQHMRYRRLIVIPNVRADAHEDEHERLAAVVLERRLDEAVAMIERHMMITVDALDAAGYWTAGPEPET